MSQYISGPILLIVLSFAYPQFDQKHKFDPIMIYGFSIVHLVVPLVVGGLLLPSWFNWVIPAAIIPKGDKPVAPMETIDNTQEITRAVSEESGAAYGEQGEMKQAPPSYDNTVEPKGELK